MISSRVGEVLGKFYVIFSMGLDKCLVSISFQTGTVVWLATEESESSLEGFQPTVQKIMRKSRSTPRSSVGGTCFLRLLWDDDGDVYTSMVMVAFRLFCG